jgi:hypothetical protein
MAMDFPLMTASDVASLAGVRPGTIRQWRHRGYITPVGGSDRYPLYDTGAVLATCGRRGCTRQLCATAAAQGDLQDVFVNAMLVNAA